MCVTEDDVWTWAPRLLLTTSPISVYTDRSSSHHNCPLIFWIRVVCLRVCVIMTIFIPATCDIWLYNIILRSVWSLRWTDWNDKENDNRLGYFLPLHSLGCHYYQWPVWRAILSFPGLFFIIFSHFCSFMVWIWGFKVGVLDWVFAVGFSVDGGWGLWCGAFWVFGLGLSRYT